MKKSKFLFLFITLTFAFQSTQAELSVDPQVPDYSTGLNYCYYDTMIIPCENKQESNLMKIRCLNGQNFDLVSKIKFINTAASEALVEISGVEFSVDLIGCHITKM